MKRIAAALIVVFSAAFAVEAQYGVRTVTNEDLAKFRDRRLAAEKEYRENYEKLGMPSPEKLEEMRERDMESRLMLAEQLRQARLEKERLELDRTRIDLEADRYAMERMAAERMAEETRVVYQSYGYGGSYGGYYGGYGYPRYGGFGFPRYGGFRVGIGLGNFLPGYVPLRGYPSNRLLPLVTVPGSDYAPYGFRGGNQVIRGLPLNQRPRRGR